MQRSSRRPCSSHPVVPLPRPVGQPSPDGWSCVWSCAPGAVLHPSELVLHASLPSATPVRATSASWRTRGSHLETVEDAKPSTLRDHRALLTRKPGGAPIAEAGQDPRPGDARPRRPAGGGGHDRQETSKRSSSSSTASRCRAAPSTSTAPRSTRSSASASRGAAEPLAARRQPSGRHAQATLRELTTSRSSPSNRSSARPTAETGAWRHEREYAAVNTVHLRRAEDRELADLLRVAAYTGLRRESSWYFAGRTSSGQRAHREKSAVGDGGEDDQEPPHPLRPARRSGARRARPAVAAAELHRSAGLRLRHRGGRRTRRRCGVATSRVATPPACRRCDSAICATRPAACSCACSTR